MLVNMHRTVGQNLSDVHVEPSYLQPSGGGGGGGLFLCGSLAVWLFFSYLNPCVQFRACAGTSIGVIFRQDSDFYASLGPFQALCVLYGAQVGS